ncbi:MAG: FecR domain-containing protein, partial [Lachnospiraceae bacterium]|nr:FecR domain-containing protein [Lachnospiraceae bacterium]
MSNRYQKLHLLKKVMGVLLVLTAALMVTQVAYAAKKKAMKFVLEKTQGTVRVESSAKEELDLWDGMQLYNGDHQITDQASYAWVSLDESKVIKLDENTETMLKKAFLSKKLEVRTLKGKLFFNVTVPLANDEAYSIRTSTMVTGIRGTSGWVEVSDDWLSTVFLLTGELECLVVNPLDNGSETITLKPGQYAEFYVFPKSEMGNEEVSCGVTLKTFTMEDIPGFVLEELLEDKELRDKVAKESKIDFSGLTPEYVAERKKLDQENHQKEILEINDRAADELNIVEKDPVWKPAGAEKASAVAYLIMPQTATTVQKYLNIDKYRKVVLLPGNGTEDDNTLKVDIDLKTPEGKTLETSAGVPMLVQKGSSFTVDGTANLYARMTNEGTVTVRSSNTLMLQEILVNMGVLEITETGRLVLGKGMTTSGTFKYAGTVEAAPGASGEEMIVIDGGEVFMLAGMISSNRYESIMRLSSGAKAEFHFSGGTIANEMEDGASILAGEEDFQVTVLGTDIIGVTDTILGKEAVLEKYNAGSVFRKDERFHLIELDKVDSYPVVVANVEHGTIIAPSRVEVGAKVTLIAVPDEGYELESLTVNAYNAKTKRTGGSVFLAADHSFIMPASDVIVGGSFVKINDASKYQINITATKGGTVTAVPAEADAGETVSLTIQGKKGHELESLTVTKADGSAIGVVASGENYQFVMPTSDVNVRAAFRALDVNVVFYDEDKVTVLNHQTVPYGTVPKYAGTTEPEKKSDEEYSYVFAGWQIAGSEETCAADAALPAVTEDVKFIAVYAKKELDKPYVAPTTYTVTWRDWDGSVIKTDSGLARGTIPHYEGDVVYRDPDDHYSYDMTGWTSAAGTFYNEEELPAVTADITYTAHYDLTVRKYTILWVNEDNSELEKDTLVPYGETPEYNGQTPTKQSTPQYSYRFEGWNPGVVPVTGDATYTAVYAEEINSYVITFLGDNGVVLGNDAWEYGSTPSVSTTPEKQGNAEFSYDFTGWDHEIQPVTGTDTYQALFAARTNAYKVTWLNWDSTPLETEYNVLYGTRASYPGATAPGRTGNQQFSYNFAGWEVGTTQYATGALMPEVQGELTLKAYFDEIVNQYDVTFLDDDQTTVIQATAAYDYGTEGTNYAPANPTKQETAKFTYAFDGWTTDGTTKYQTAADLPKVTGDVTYVATYKETIKQYAVSFVNYDGTALLVNGQASQSYDYDTLGSAIARPADPSR